MSTEIYNPKADSLPYKVCQYFSRLQDEELSVKDIELKFDVSAGSIHTNLAKAVSTELLHRDGQIYSAGIALSGWSARQSQEHSTLASTFSQGKKSKPTSGFSSPRHQLDITQLMVEDNVPFTAPHTKGASKWDDLFAKLTKAGQSIEVPAEVKGALAAEANKRNGKKTGATYKVAVTSATKARIWRLA